MTSSRRRLVIGLLNCFAFAAASLAQTPPARSAVIATTRQGRIAGQQNSDGSFTFQGIPYAQPPVGDLRWRGPRPARPWSGLRDGTVSPPACMQMDWKWNSEDAKHDSEDCLYLNIATPSWPVRQKLPVLVWIHGGANYNGSGRLRQQTLTRHGIVLVTMNYRLGVFGFLAHPELTRESDHHSSGNYAILDQIAALRWVHQNIGAFGGDPARITIAGQSAGAIDTGTLLLTPLAKGLFKGAIDESGGPIPPQPKLPTLDLAEALGEKLSAFAGGDIAHLRSLTARQLLEVANRFTAPDPEGVPTHPAPAPNVDGWVLPLQPGALVQNGNISVPLLIGSNVQEFSFSHSSTISAGTPEPIDSLRAAIAMDYGHQASKAMDLYGFSDSKAPPPDPLLGTVGTQLMTDTFFCCPATITTGWLAEQGKPAWQYQFEQPLPGTGASSTRHSGELPYVFGSPQIPGGAMMGATFGPNDVAISKQMQGYWTNFVKTGNPNGPGLAEWPREERGSSVLMRFTPRGPVVARNERVPLCTLYEQQLQQLGATAKH